MEGGRLRSSDSRRWEKEGEVRSMLSVPCLSTCQRGLTGCIDSRGEAGEGRDGREEGRMCRARGTLVGA
jgi:hypothetical protein